MVSISKSRFYAARLKWCGPVIDGTGVTLDSSKVSGLRDAAQPENAAELCQYIHVSTWMARAIPRFAEHISPLRDQLEITYKKSRKRKRKAIERIRETTLGWSEEHSRAYESMEEQLRYAVTNALRDPMRTLCIHTDASDAHWAAALIQCRPGDLGKPISEKSHAPLAFLSGAFSETQEHWTTNEKEAFVIVQSFHKLSHSFACDASTIIFPNHRNVPFNFNPAAFDLSLERHKILKSIRWALFFINDLIQN